MTRREYSACRISKNENPVAMLARDGIVRNALRSCLVRLSPSLFLNHRASSIRCGISRWRSRGRLDGYRQEGYRSHSYGSSKAARFVVAGSARPGSPGLHRNVLRASLLRACDKFDDFDPSTLPCEGLNCSRAETGPRLIRRVPPKPPARFGFFYVRNAQAFGSICEGGSSRGNFRPGVKSGRSDAGEDHDGACFIGNADSTTYSLHASGDFSDHRLSGFEVADKNSRLYQYDPITVQDFEIVLFNVRRSDRPWQKSLGRALGTPMRIAFSPKRRPKRDRYTANVAAV
jgi:hypothetical protein